MRIYVFALIAIFIIALAIVSAPAASPENAGVSLSGGQFSSLTEDRGAMSIEAEQLRIDAALAEAARLKAEIDAANAWKITRYGRTGVDWDGIAQCETGSNWSHRGNAPGGSHYEGGVGFLHEAWTDFGGEDFAPHAYEATREEQIVVAERLHDEHGLSGWGCKAYG